MDAQDMQEFFDSLKAKIAEAKKALADGFQLWEDLPVYIAIFQFIFNSAQLIKDTHPKGKADLIVKALEEFDEEYLLYDKLMATLKAKIGFFFGFLKYIPGVRKWVKSKESFFASLNAMLVEKFGG